MCELVLSDKAQAVRAMLTEIESIERLQLETGEQISKLIDKQVRLSIKCEILHSTLEKLLGGVK